MSYDKAENSKATASPQKSIDWVLLGVPKLFQFAEWLLVIVAFQYVGARFNLASINAVWIVLCAALTAYVTAWLGRAFHRIPQNRQVTSVRALVAWMTVIYIGTPLFLGAAAYFLFRLVIDQMVAHQ